MNSLLNTDFDDDLDFERDLPRVRNMTQGRKTADHFAHKAVMVNRVRKVSINDDLDKFTYQPSRHESQWLMSSLGEFYELRWFDDILRMVKGGKEASVYQVKANANVGVPYLAAKVYRPRQFRNLKKDHLYREGRSQLETDGKVILDDGMLHAMEKKTSYGMELLHESWLGSEFKTMQILANAGADIPKPYASGKNAILMDFIGDEDAAAPSLNSINLTFTEAREIFQRVVYNIEICLEHRRIHADLSAYNILYWEGKITLIDFPQAIDPDENHNAYAIFQRDVLRVCEYFAAQGVESNPERLAKTMWLARGRATAPEVDPHFLDPEKAEDRKAWDNLKQP